MTTPSWRTIILVGNPNVGKSVLFSKLTGKFVIISNYPGTTVEITRGETEIDGARCAVIDTPGINELAVRSEDARVTCDVLRDNPDAVIVQVADAKNLSRALLLTTHLAELGRPMVLALNMMDELDGTGHRIDTARLSEILGIPVVPTVAVTRSGIPLLEKSIPQAVVPARLEPPPAAPAEPGLPCQDEEYRHNVARMGRIQQILARTFIAARPQHPTFAQELGMWAAHPVKGLFLLAAVLGITFWCVGLFAAGTLVDFFETIVFQRHLNVWTIRATDALLPFPHHHEVETSDYAFEIPLAPNRGIELARSSAEVISPSYALSPTGTSAWWHGPARFVHDFLVGEFGAVTMAISYGFAIVLPIVTAFFLLFSALEDSGYLSRMAVLVNRIFRAMGLNGKAVLPLVLGLGCDTMATMTTRILETRKERVVTTLLLALAVPCSAQLGVLMALAAKISWAAVALWMGLLLAILFAAGWLTARLYGGPSTDFILELPPMRRPDFRNVAAKTFARLKWYLQEVIPLFVAGTAILFLLDKLNLLGGIARLGEPVVTGWLGLPRETANAFLVGFLRRDYGAVYLLDAASGPTPLLTPHQVLVAMMTITLFMPCIAMLFMISRELGRKTAAVVTFVVFLLSFAIGGAVHHAAHWIGL